MQGFDLREIQNNYLPLPLPPLPLVASTRSASFSGISCKWSYAQWKEPTPKVSDAYVGRLRNYKM
ncbi:hypothetical protein H1Q63_09890 [Desmonostoc muscorum CCALA 125]|nr:hypothetical protein [Desmonostoc muscorum CCALA 125]